MSEDSDKDRDQFGQPLTPEDFAPIAFELLGASSIGNFKDEFGGELIYIYRTFANGRGMKISSNLKLYLEGDREIINSMLPDAKEVYRKRLFQKLRDAADSLAQEALAPIYEATGLKWDTVYPVPVLDQGRMTLEDEIVRRELKDGHISYRKLKKTGRPSQWTPVKLEHEVKRAAKKIVKWNSKPRQKEPKKLTLDNVVAEMNKLRDAQAQLTDDAVKQALVRNGLTWKEVKRAVTRR
jgi:hypothetical protein